MVLSRNSEDRRTIEYTLPAPIVVGDHKYKATVSYPEGTDIKDIIRMQDMAADQLMKYRGTKLMFRGNDISVTIEEIDPAHDFRVGRSYSIETENVPLGPSPSLPRASRRLEHVH
jgi:hypothetical protein